MKEGKTRIRQAAADLYEAQCKTMCFLSPLDAVHNQQAAGSALEGPYIQQGFQKSPWTAHSSKEGGPHLGICLASHTHHYVSEDWEVANELSCCL